MRTEGRIRSFGKRHMLRGSVCIPLKLFRVLPAKHSLSILHTCRQIHIEANPLWARLVLVHFGSINAMVDKIRSLPQDTMKEIRQMRVRWYHQPIYGIDHRWSLLTLYKLCLDRLTVLFDKVVYGTDNITQFMLELATHGCGWKELHCLTNSSVLSEFSKASNSNVFVQPHSLGSMGIFTLEELKMEFLKRDGPSSDALIKICWSKTCAHIGIRNMIDSKSYIEVDKKEPLTPTQPRTSCKWTLLVAKRASNVDVMLPTSPHENKFPVLTWDQATERLSQSRSLAMQYKYTGDIYDKYKSPLDYSWQLCKNEYPQKKEPCE